MRGLRAEKTEVLRERGIHPGLKNKILGYKFNFFFTISQKMGMAQGR